MQTMRDYVTHDPGISITGWTRQQLHQTRLDWNIAWTHMEDLSTSDRYKVTVPYRELIQQS